MYVHLLTVAQNTHMTIIQFYLSANSVYLVIYTICATLGVFCPPLRGAYSPCPPNRGIPL